MKAGPLSHSAGPLPQSARGPVHMAAALKSSAGASCWFVGVGHKWEGGVMGHAGGGARHVLWREEVDLAAAVYAHILSLKPFPGMPLALLGLISAKWV